MLVAEHKVEVPTHTFIPAQPYPTSRKGTMCKRVLKFNCTIKQSVPLFLWYNIPPVIHHKTALRHTNAHTKIVFTDICSLEAMIYAHYLFGGKELEVLTDRLNDQCDIYKHIEWWFDNEF